MGRKPVRVTDYKSAVLEYLVFHPCHPRRDRTTGIVYTRNGLIEFVTSGAAEQPEYTILYFVYGGSVHHRHFDKAYASRHIITLAKRFTAEVTGSQKP